MKKTIIITFFSLTVLAQLLVPLQMIWQEEKIINEGTVYKFKTQPIDPSDPFRGKYITLNYEIDGFKTSDSNWSNTNHVYVYFKTDSLGYASVKTVSKIKLENQNSDFIKVKNPWYSSYSQTVNFNLPFDRFYMEEHKAKPAETVVTRRGQNNSLVTYAKVAIKDGRATLVDVMVNDISIADYVKQAGDK